MYAKNITIRQTITSIITNVLDSYFQVTCSNVTETIFTKFEILMAPRILLCAFYLAQNTLISLKWAKWNYLSIPNNKSNLSRPIRFFHIHMISKSGIVSTIPQQNTSLSYQLVKIDILVCQ